MGAGKLFLREYLYVDIDKVKGLAGQLYDGVPERAINLKARQKSFELDMKLLRGGSSSGKEQSIERNMSDTLFKDLEADLESLGLLADLSEYLTGDEAWANPELLVRPGKIVRVTAPGSLFHPSQLSEAIIGIVTAAHGLGEMGLADEGQSPAVPPKAKTESQKKADRQAKQQEQKEPRFPEDFLHPGAVVPVLGIKREQLSGMIKVVRGVFGEGVHLHLRPRGAEGPTITARLESGRRFLDSSPEVLFSRYGLGQQEWTIVGVVGQLGENSTSNEFNNVTNQDETINRAKFVDLVKSLLGSAAGLIDLPQAPGFSVVPLAVYRTIGSSLNAEQLP